MAIPLIPLGIGLVLLIKSKSKPKAPPKAPPTHDLPEQPGKDLTAKDVTGIVGGIGSVAVAIIPIIKAAVVGAGAATGTAATVAVIAPTTVAAGTASGAVSTATGSAAAAAAGLSSAAAGGIVFAVIVIIIVTTVLIFVTFTGYESWKASFTEAFSAPPQAHFVTEGLYGEQFYSQGVWQYLNEKRGLIPEIKKITDAFCELTVEPQPQINYSNKFLTKLIRFTTD